MVGGATGQSGQSAHGPVGAGCSAAHASATSQRKGNGKVGMTRSLSQWFLQDLSILGVHGASCSRGTLPLLPAQFSVVVVLLFSVLS